MSYDPYGTPPTDQPSAGTPYPPYYPPPTNQPPPGYPPYPQGGGYPPYWQAPPMPPVPEPLPAYRGADPEADRTVLRQVFPVSALRPDHLAAIDNQGKFPFWMPILVASVFLFAFSITAIGLTAEKSMAQAGGVGFLCMIAVAVFSLFAALAVNRRRTENRRLTAYAAVAQETAGVVEVYSDRLVRITPHTRTIVWLHTKRTVVWEAPNLMTISDGYAAIAIPAECLTESALKTLRQAVYPAIRPENRKSTGRMFGTATVMADLPAIELSEEMLYRFSYRPDPAAERDRRTMNGVWKSLPFVAVAAVMMGAVLGAIFRCSIPLFGMVAMLSLGCYCILQLLTYMIVRSTVKANEWPPSAIGVAFTLGGLAVEEFGCVRFIPHGWYTYMTRKEALLLQLPIGQLYIPWTDIPDRDVVKRLLMLGD